MVGLGCSIAFTVIGAVAVVLVSSVGFGVIPKVIENAIINNFVLFDDTLQMERFKETPFPLNVSFHIFNITNPDAVLQGATPRVQEVGPYVYRLYQERIIEDIQEDSIKYRFRSRYEFDAITSYPLTEDDQLTITNLAYNAILQVVEQDMPTLMGVVNSAIDSVFGEHNEPISKVRVGSLILDGLRICQDPGFIGQVVCSEIRASAEGSRNLETQEDQSVLFSLFNYKRTHLSELYETHRGTANPSDLGRITAWNGRGFLPYWMDPASRCNMINGTDTGVYRPFIKRDEVIQAFNMDICRSVELRYQYDTEFDGIPVARYAANEWFLSNEEGCFCLKVTNGISRPDGCLLSGAMELYTCSGSFTVLTYPHFLFADQRYANGVIGMTPDLESHRIFLDIQLDTGIPVRGGKRAQVNVFLRPIQGITATANLTTTLTPVFWLQEGMQLPEELRAELKDQLLAPQRLINILVPVFMAISCLALLLGSYLLYGAIRRNGAQNTNTEDTTNVKGD